MKKSNKLIIFSVLSMLISIALGYLPSYLVTVIHIGTWYLLPTEIFAVIFSILFFVVALGVVPSIFDYKKKERLAAD
jgi:hypothetical protein